MDAVHMDQGPQTLDREALKHVIVRSGGDLTEAARLAGVSRSMFVRLAIKYRLRIRDHADDVSR
jgi:hypothetical protein